MSSVPDHTQISYAYGNYTNFGYHVSGQGVNNITNYQYSPSNPLEELEGHCSPSAAFDSAARFDPPRCAQSTRLRIIRMIEEWISSEGDHDAPSSLFWLYGGAGAGKSAIAQSLSEKFQKQKQLAASFFFFRSDETRNTGGNLIPTLVSHLVEAFEGVLPFVEDRIRKHRAIFTKRPEIQIQELLIEPLLALKSQGVPLTHPRLIVIDGLDECQNSGVQCELLRVIAHAIPQIPYPLRFLVTSRPEAHIMRLFNHDLGLKAIAVHRDNLSDDPDADMDIRKFLVKEFVEIHRVHPVGSRLPHSWPNHEAITSLVGRSSGHFIYASTVISYIRSPKHRPDDRLEVILRLRPPREGDRPYAQLDAVYSLIFEGVESHAQLEKICLVLGILYFQSRRIGHFRTNPSIEALLEMKAGDLDLLLDPILSLIVIDGDKVRILHKSLFDYLLDSTRGGHLPFDLARVHESGATYILKQKIVGVTCNLTDYGYFAHHCRYAYLNDSLKHFLHSLDVHYPNSFMTTPVKSYDNDRLLQPSIMWHFVRTLSRKDFDPTGQVHEQYIAKWFSYLRSQPTQNSSRAAVAKVNAWLKGNLDKWLPKSKTPADATLDDLKRTLHTVLTEWNPLSFTPVLVRMAEMESIRRCAMIKQEHNLSSAYVEALFCGITNVFASSLVFGDLYIHSYCLAIQDSGSTLFLQTYSRHGDVQFQDGWNGDVNFLQDYITRDYLMMVEQHISSDLSKKYGVEQSDDY